MEINGMESANQEVSGLFPCRSIPDDPGAARLLGLYPQAQEALWMQRVKVLGGRLTGGQWRALAGIARRLTPATPLHLTTRQDVEIHDLAAGQVPHVQGLLHAASLTSLGACGDTLRNITICPCSGAWAGTVDLAPLAWQVRRMLEAHEGIFALPRKFKIALSCSPQCGQPWINDLGLTAARRNGRWGFRVTVAGSLGARPGAGVLWKEWTPADEVLPLTLAAVRVFAAEGDRRNRRRARLRHVRERVGDEKFLALLDEALAAALAQRPWPTAELAEADPPLAASRTLTFPNGDVTPEAAEALAGLAGGDEFRVRIANHHHVIVFARDEAAVDRALAAHDPLAAPARAQASVVACPGRRWCSRALVHTNALADRIRRDLAEVLPPGTTVCVSGCPNGCSHPAVADIGLIGALAGEKGARREVFSLYVGGGMGRSDQLAERAARKLTADEVVTEIARLRGGGD